MALTHTFVRRGLEAANDAFARQKDGNRDGDETPVNPLPVLIIALTVLFFALVMVAVSSIITLPD